MLQTEQEFVRILKSRLEGTLPPEELSDIVSDYTEHFRIGRTEGRLEEDLFRSLGSPEDIAREIRATHLVKKAEAVTSCKNILHAVLATIGLGLFNLVFVLIPFIILVLLLVIIFIVGVAFTVCGPVAGIFALLQLAGNPSFAIWLSPAAGIFFSIGITALGLLLVIGDLFLARFFYHIGIRYLKWNIGVITGTERLT
ncbi:HAAS signaling domain-containing protein [Methanoregula sp.]|uniref:HAAS signaling domain-containing protein n=1 Tax=Methanoregula sp. TaxID=2052170 RepID=UPI000CBD8F6F|nr:DUF1700 domain-containing protein [Methanoregula sp.]PKG33124.1 MAG: hypothetical protein CW742_04585 [Methanoregula sp.]